MEIIKLDLGCGQNPTLGFKGVDLWSGADIVHDLTVFPYPFADNSVDEIVCNHFVEHIDGDTFIKFMDECYRILKPSNTTIHNSPTSGIMRICSPYYTSIRCWQDPTHKQAISEAKFLYFNKGWRDQNKLDHYPIKSDFDYSFGFNFNPPWHTKSDEVKQFAVTHYVNVISDINVVLAKRG